MRRRLDVELVRRKLARGRTEARELIEAGRVSVTGLATPKPATMVAPDAGISVDAPPARFVSRGGLKLEAAIDAFDVDPDGRRCLDVGSSTGGFTDCLLQRGAAHVTALDVGTNQLDYRLRTDDRVEVMERTTIRGADPGAIGAPFDIVVCDVSFIGVARIAPDLAAMGGEGTDYIILVKPQFEAGRDDVARGGVVRDAEVRHRAVLTAVNALEAEGLGLVGIIASPVTGAKSGNQEFLAHHRRGASTIGGDDLATVVCMEDDE